MDQLFNVLLLIFGFGFVIFFHELGHFLAAKWVGIKVEQFAVGFGQALLAWRKGVGLRIGSTKKEVLARAKAYLRENEGLKARHETVEAGDDEQRISVAAAALGLGDTEYRLNWIPLGGYVKMLGQDDLRPNSKADDPRAYNKKPIGQRMIVVSAGVIMNVILAAIGFMVLFLMGFNVQPAVVGTVQPNSPATMTVRQDDGRLAPLQVGDRIVYYDGKFQHDFTKITLNVALSKAQRVPIEVERVDGTMEQLFITPQRAAGDRNGFPSIGVGRPSELRGLDAKTARAVEDVRQADIVHPDALALNPGDIITHINGEPVEVKEYYKLDRAMQAFDGEPIILRVTRADGRIEDVSFKPIFAPPFGRDSLAFAGMVPRAAIEMIFPKSPARGKLLPGDAVMQISFAGGVDPIADPSGEALRDRLNKAGQAGKAVDMIVLRGGHAKVVTDITPNVRLPESRYGLNVQLTWDDHNAVVASTLEKSSAASAAIPAGSRLTAINDQPVKNWFDVRRVLKSVTPGQAVTVSFETDAGPGQRVMHPTAEEIAQVAGYTFTHRLALHERIEPRETSNPLVAAGWGVTETRDFILQFYLTLHRMFTGDVSYKNMMGPVGIFNAGWHFAYKGPDWLIWFLAMISANLAVVNFLPIPIVDGGLFLFLIIEKIQGKPLSPRTQSIAQVVGLAIILSVFLLVTYQDVARLGSW